MKRSRPLILSLFILAVLLPSCIRGGDRVSRMLDAADTLMFRAPDSAVALLDSLELGSASRAERARHALLLTKAREKADTVITNDSLITVAADYYRGRGDSLETQSLFYRGVILANSGDHSNALLSLMQAADLARATGDDFYLAMSYREQADIYNILHATAKRAEYAEMATEYFYKSNKPLHALREKLMLAQSLILLNKTSEVSPLLSDIRKDTLLNNRNFAALYHRVMERYFYLTKDFKSSLNHSDSILLYSGKLSSIELSNRSLSAIALSRLDSASIYLRDAGASIKNKVDSANYLYVSAQLYAAKGDYERFYDAFKKYYADEVRMHNHLLSYPYTSLLTQHYILQSEKNHLKYSQTQRYVWLSLLISFLLVVVIICLVIIFRNRFRIKQERVEILISELSQFEKKIRLLETKHVAQEEPRHDHSKPYPFLPIINGLYDVIADVPDSDKKHNMLGKKVDKLLSDFHTEGIYSELEEYLNATAGNLMTRFREQVKGISDKKYAAAILIFAGFSNNFIYTAMRYTSIASVRSIKRRIKEDIIRSSAADKDEFLDYI